MPGLRRASLVLAFIAGPAAGQSAERPEVSAGDEWSFVVYYAVPSTKPNRRWIVTSVTPAGIAATENGDPLLLTRELGVLDSPRVRESNPRVLDFPLEVGKRWRYPTEWLNKQKGSNGTLAMEVAVAAHERIKVPAGTFDAFKLVAKGTLGGATPGGSFFAGEVTTTYWYAPAARAIVKSVSHNPYLGTTNVELVAFKLH